MAGTFRELSEAFTKAAAQFPHRGDTDLLLTRYELLLRYKAETEEQKAQVVETLYESGLEVLRGYTAPTPRYSIDEEDGRRINTVFLELVRDESVGYVPAAAPAELADIVCDLLARIDTVREEDITYNMSLENYRKSLAAFARRALAAADAFREVQEERAMDIKTTKDLVPGKRLIIKQKEPPVS